MKNFRRSLALSCAWACLFALGVANAKPVKNKYGTVENGHVPEQVRNELSEEVKWAQQNMSQEQYAAVVADPQQARNDQERLAGLSAREIFILVDRSGSMQVDDDNPTGVHTGRWTRWDSCRVAAESISEVALSLDADSEVDIILWNGSQNGGLQAIDTTMGNPGQIADLFRTHQPSGTTPLAEALEYIYAKRLKALLQKSEPFTVVVLTDGAPNNPNAVRDFFKKVIRENNLETKGRETLAAFSLVRIGDDEGAKRFLGDLDDNLISQLNVNVDIVDTKEDNFLFGTGKYRGQSSVGPFALFWDALYD